ncbi:MAG: hypothetical protein EOP62_23095 [Sphingomonadales bacterium]|nr:MAG: hypothetical protein EOP62_23095 [Sphingomonadales bacterium]
MTDIVKDEDALRAVRDTLRVQLAILDGLAESEAAIEINSCIEILNARLDEPTTAAEIEEMQRRYLSD